MLPAGTERNRILLAFLEMNLQEIKTLLELVSQPFLSIGILE